MTAEIAILNKSAVALAADSKVTIDVGGSEKTYDTVNKLFTLSKVHPLGAMIYGSAEYMGFPWETIIKGYRTDRAGRQFDTVFDCAEDFKSYLNNFFKFSDKDGEENVYNICASSLQALIKGAIAHAYQEESRGDIELSRIASDEFDSVNASYEGIEKYYDDDEWKKIELKLRGVFNSAVMESIPVADEGVKKKGIQFCHNVISRKTSSISSSGLVIAGFGEKELFPSIVNYEIDGLVCGNIKIIERTRYNVSRKEGGTIIPFAQSDMVGRFMEGIDPQYREFLSSTIIDVMIRNGLEIAKIFDENVVNDQKFVELLRKSIVESVQKYEETAAKFRHANFVSPIIDMTLRLPKDELAHLAESLVSLTSLQRRVSRDVETVGGAIDVAVISKGDGFVWIKRKHYFSADRNISFVNRYLREYEQKTQASGGEPNG